MWRLWGRTLVYLRPQWRLALLVVAALLVHAAVDTMFPLGYKWLIDWAVIPRDPRWFAILMAGLGVASSCPRWSPSGGNTSAPTSESGP